jgi:hypothetical protein
MKRSVEKVPAVRFEDGVFFIVFDGGAEIRFPAKGNRRLEAGTPKQLSRMEVSPFGIHWPDLDEDLSFEGLARGDYGQFANCPLDRYPERAVPPLSVAEEGAAYDKPEESAPPPSP